MALSDLARAKLEGAGEPDAALAEAGGGGHVYCTAMVLPWVFLWRMRRAVLGSTEAAVCGFRTVRGSCHTFCTASKDVTYKELKNLLNSKNILLIDVRETWEVLKYGKIPGAINIPLGEVGHALQMNPRDFKDKYNEVKPSESDNLVFSCLAGLRSKKALDTALSLGFKSAQHYAGGWKEWTTYEVSDSKQGN
ncbi:PREDICTED: thiosulfate sulfurtransferase/rhodanese-like domain-containing protein 3 [Chrysochloris asiatica]|uniref:Sulfurtransferase n=1 Tax=Chrysochloris asiatica TaxID=185453 RepID=A0A9B0WT23_CHRAS|nr:PREDICTED: thiosulfate sulfurtransferase/rhodanese-like domain-containing protein 3 [Chrysochloris asiatica]